MKMNAEYIGIVVGEIQNRILRHDTFLKHFVLILQKQR